MSFAASSSLRDTLRHRGRSGFLHGRILCRPQTECPGDSLSGRAHLRRHPQPVPLEAAVGRSRGIDHLDRDNRLVTGHVAALQRAVALVVIEAHSPGIADEGGGAVDLLAVAIPLDHDAADFRVGFPVNMYILALC